MALVKCPDCEKMISSRVQQCPFCGCPAEFFIEKGENNDSGESSSSIRLNTEMDKTASVNISEMSNIATEKLHEDANVSEIEDSNLPVSNTEVVFGFDVEQYPEKNKYPFEVITDSERESDKHAKGKTHVMFRIGESKYLTVSKSDLFFAPLYYEADDELYKMLDKFKQYMTKVASLDELKSGTIAVSKKLILLYCEFLVQKLVQYEVYEYDLENFTKRCGSGIQLELSDEYYVPDLMSCHAAALFVCR